MTLPRSIPELTNATDSGPTDIADPAAPPGQADSTDTARAEFFQRKFIVQEVVNGVCGPRPLDFALIGAKYMGKSRVLRHLASANGPIEKREGPRGRRKVIPLYYDCKQLQGWSTEQGAKPREGADESRKGLFMTELVDFVIQQLQTRESEKEGRGLHGARPDWEEIDQEERPVAKLWKVVRQLGQEDVRLALLLDNFDTVLKQKAVTMDELNELRPLTRELALVVSSEQPLPDVNSELMASPLFNVMHQIFLGLIDKETALPWLRKLVENQVQGQAEKHVEELWEWTGGHPFLLARVADVLQDVMARWFGGVFPSDLIRLRLAEHSRFVFNTLAKKIREAAQDQTTPVLALQEVVRRLVDSEKGTTRFELPRHGPALNWLINQALVIYDSEGYRLFSPLFREYLRTHWPFTQEEAQVALEGEDMERFLNRLTPKEGALLRYFIAHPDEVIPTEQLLADIWRHHDASSTRRVQEGIRRLRLRLSQASPPIGRIENERGRGYRFVPATWKGNGYAP